VKWIYNISGSICVGLAFAGIFLPLLPTTPFLLLAAFCFSKGSPRLHRWLIEHPRLGPIIEEWNQHRIIRPRVKWMSSIMIILLMTPALVFGNFSPWLKAVSVVVGTGVIAMVFRARSQR
jgi:uncharacterized membrane protein YbaN (DUF454 family)